MSHKHRNVLQAIFHDPLSSNIQWREVESLLHHLGATVEPGAVLGHVTDPRDWCIQNRIELNTMRTDPTTSGPVDSIIDLGVYIVFEWDPSRLGADRLVHFEVAGLLTRSSPDNPKVNVALGGCVVPVFVSKT